MIVLRGGILMNQQFFTNEMKEALISGLINILPGKLDRVILYGSVARGDATSDSDVDIVLILRSGFAANEKEAFFHWNAELDLKYNRVFSIVDIELDCLNKWGTVVPFYKSIQNEGVVLWKAA